MSSTLWLFNCNLYHLVVLTSELPQQFQLAHVVGLVPVLEGYSLSKCVTVSVLSFNCLRRNVLQCF